MKLDKLTKAVESVYPEDSLQEVISETKNTHWHCIEGGLFYPAKPTVDKLPPGFYRVFQVQGEIKFLKETFSTEGIFPTGSENAVEILEDFRKFWGAEETFKKYEVSYKRGLLLSGPPGTGKTCIIKLLAEEMVNNLKGMVLDLRDVTYLVGEAISAIHNIQPESKIMIVMEDINHYYQDAKSALLNVMDGMKYIDKVMFVATTNSIDDLDEALVNRPGRFDSHYVIRPANEEVREMFIRTLIPEEDVKVNKISIKKWAKDTKGLPFGHIRELVLSVMVFGKDYNKTLNRLKTMRDGQVEEDDDDLENEPVSVPKAVINSLRKR